MNAQGRKQLASIQTDVNKLKEQLETLKEHVENNDPNVDVAACATELAGAASDVQSQLESIKDEEQEKYDNMPESLQNGDGGDRLQQCIEALENAEDKAGAIEGELNDFDKELAGDELLHWIGEQIEGCETVDGYIDDAINA